jgi:choline dehydrogenase-like flavoprotein
MRGGYLADYDLIVIGSGAARATAATTAVHPGASHVVIVEQGPLWGSEYPFNKILLLIVAGLIYLIPILVSLIFNR